MSAADPFNVDLDWVPDEVEDAEDDDQWPPIAPRLPRPRNRREEEEKTEEVIVGIYKLLLMLCFGYATWNVVVLPVWCLLGMVGRFMERIWEMMGG